MIKPLCKRCGQAYDPAMDVKMSKQLCNPCWRIDAKKRADALADKIAKQIKIKSAPVKAKLRKLRAKWTVESATDFVDRMQGRKR